MRIAPLSSRNFGFIEYPKFLQIYSRSTSLPAFKYFYFLTYSLSSVTFFWKRNHRTMQQIHSIRTITMETETLVEQALLEKTGRSQAFVDDGRNKQRPIVEKSDENAKISRWILDPARPHPTSSDSFPASLHFSRAFSKNTLNICPRSP